MRELEVQLRRTERGLVGGRLRDRFLRERRAAIVLFFRDRVLGAQAFGALQLGVGALTRGPRASELRAQTIALGLEGPGIDLEEQGASLDDGAFLEADRRDETRYARPDVNRIDGLQPAGELVPLGHLALDDLGDGDLWRRWWTLLRCGL